MKSFIKRFFPLIFINLFSIILICFPFVSGNSFKTLDLPGHVFATTFMRDYIFPDINGWNPFQNLGYPQGSHYPPLIQYITSGISRITSLDIISIYKIFIVLTILLLPWVIYFFLKRVSRDKLSNLVLNGITVIVFLMFIMLPSTFGGSLKSVLSTGLLNNFLTIPIFYLYLTYLYDLLTSKANRLLIIKLSLLLSILILAHLVSGLVGAFIGGVLILYKVIKQRELKVILIPIICLILTGFYVIPYALNLRYLTSSKPILSDLIYSLAIFILALATTLFIYFKTKNRTYIFLSISAILLSLVPLFEAVSYRVSGLSSLQLINAYRLLPYAFFLGVPVFLLTLSKSINLKPKIELIGVVILLILTPILIYKSDLELTDIGDIDSDKVFSSTLPSNYIDLYSRYDIWDNLRIPYMNINDIKNGNFSVIGQFEESSYLNHFALSLKNSIDETIKKTPVSKIVYIEDMKLNPSKVSLVKDLFNLGYGLILNENIKSICEKITELQSFKTRYNDKGVFNMRDDTLSLCDLIENPKSDVNIYSNAGIFRGVNKGDWNSEVINWWGSDKNEILVEAYDMESWDNSFGIGENSKLDANIRFNWKDNYQSFDFNIPTVENSWALVKEQYNPRWKAYSESGSELKVYRVSPSMMLVNSKGKVTFKYEFPLYEKLLKYTSIISFVFMLFYVIVRKVKRTGINGKKK